MATRTNQTVGAAWTAWAEGMKARLDQRQRGYVQRSLFGGLHVALERNGRRWRLAVARERSWPSATERATIGRDFGAPSGVTWSLRQKVAQGRRFRPGTRLWVAECWWVQRDSNSETTSQQRGKEQRHEGTDHHGGE
jgi:hypothetical protein